MKIIDDILGFIFISSIYLLQAIMIPLLKLTKGKEK